MNRSAAGAFGESTRISGASGRDGYDARTRSNSWRSHALSPRAVVSLEGTRKAITSRERQPPPRPAPLAPAADAAPPPSGRFTDDDRTGVRRKRSQPARQPLAIERRVFV